jgi:putative oxidoreductase
MHLELTVLFGYLQSLALLFARIAVAYGFTKPALMKWSNLDATAIWFHTLGIPLSGLFAFVTASAEIVGVVLLFLGLFTRFVSIPLMIVMIIATLTVHLGHGFSAGDGGFEIPLYYFIFLLIFASHGAGKFSLDSLLFGKDK